MDPAEKMLFDKDTTFAFIRAAQARGHESLHCQPADVFNEGREVGAAARPITVSVQEPHVTFGSVSDVNLAELDAIFLRKDPPFDAAYLYLTQQLDLVKMRTVVINDPAAVRDANEKLFAFQFADYMPPSLVTSVPARILDFMHRVGGKAVLKPLHGAGGSGVVLISPEDKNTRSLVDLLTEEGQRLAIVQEYQPAIIVGDKRVLVLDGEPLGAILRVPREDDIRANIHVGGIVQATELTEEELELVLTVGAELRRIGLWFVGLDLIGPRLIEVNVTSPTGIQELGRLEGRLPEQDVIAWVERRVEERHASLRPG
jgi:glutathione synthase